MAVGKSTCQVQVGIASVSVVPSEVSCSAGLELSILQEQLEHVRGYVDAQLESIELQIHRFAGHGQVKGTSRLRSTQGSSPPVNQHSDQEDVGPTTRILEDRLSRLEMLLFCVPVPDFQKIDESIKAIMSGDHASGSLNSAKKVDKRCKSGVEGAARVGSCDSKILESEVSVGSAFRSAPNDVPHGLPRASEEQLQHQLARSSSSSSLAHESSLDSKARRKPASELFSGFARRWLINEICLCSLYVLGFFLLYSVSAS